MSHSTFQPVPERNETLHLEVQAMSEFYLAQQLIYIRRFTGNIEGMID